MADKKKSLEITGLFCRPLVRQLADKETKVGSRNAEVRYGMKNENCKLQIAGVCVAVCCAAACKRGRGRLAAKGDCKCAKMLRMLRTLQKTRGILMISKKKGLRMLRTLQRSEIGCALSHAEAERGSRRREDGKCAKMLRMLRTLQETRGISMISKKKGLRMLRTLQRSEVGRGCRIGRVGFSWLFLMR
jgi:hypothetical protein